MKHWLWKLLRRWLDQPIISAHRVNEALVLTRADGYQCSIPNLPMSGGVYLGSESPTWRINVHWRELGRAQ